MIGDKAKVPSNRKEAKTMEATQEITVRPEPTPNPASVRFVVNRTIMERGTADFPTKSDAARSPLAQHIFEIEGVTGVFLGSNFVTVTVDEEVVHWDLLGEQVTNLIRTHFSSGEETILGGADRFQTEGGNPIEQGIIRVIETEIRPAVAMDGGDIVFGGFKDGVVSLHLRGSCSGCPSSLMTLKMGIERRLQEEFLEVLSVEAI
jgi:Fe-S cluster biogenesis protein NfuA